MFSKDGSHIKYYTYNKYLKANTLQLIGRELTPHAMRHTHASLLAEHGVDLETISRRLGHGDSRVTKEIYLHVTKTLKEKDDAQIAKVKIL